MPARRIEIAGERLVDSIAVIDQVLKRDLPQGPCWRRYNHDGYGQKADGRQQDCVRLLKFYCGSNLTILFQSKNQHQIDTDSNFKHSQNHSDYLYELGRKT